ncbi:uncharacterized protein LOC110032225 [Phalaenopsis equestris]|uniref:uncharacterized protein LOC110032225 n=1 Tax=Phalaenopsis equestris TaxID=78828 RepID=UPI0009E4FE3B|nr:uncharacterized protein LOC110032225 [Phalaenopsis equestris]XP_020591446.1 uncharacterized protein LOC110032225 [Phalaenopsis equestris]XP_020591447.1 uncharacterized protein LOC110032225 [Phalaenopsis equestris]
MEVLRKRMKTADGSEEGTAGGVDAGVEEEMTATAGSDEMIQVCSEEMESDIQRILEKIDRFTQQLSEMLETGKQLFKDLSSEFEERLIMIHREQMEKWQHDIKLLRMIDSTNEASRALLNNAQLHLLQNVREN